MKGRMKRILAAAAIALLSASLVLPVRASGAYGVNRASDSTETTEFWKCLEMDNDANIPAATFTFEASAGTEIPATDTTLAVLAGITPNKIKFTPQGGTEGTGSASIVYAAQTKENASDTKKSESDKNYVEYKANTPDESHYIAAKKMTLDFSNVVFPEPGVYRYIITESGTNAGITNDTNTTRTLDVYVEDATTTSGETETKLLKISDYVMYVGMVTTAPKSGEVTTSDTDTDSDTVENGTTKTHNGAEPDNAVKSIGFLNTYDSADLTISKTVTGNQGSRDEYFAFTIKLKTNETITEIDGDLKFKVTGQNKSPQTNAATSYTTDIMQKANNIDTLTGAQLKDGYTLYLQHGDSVTLSGLISGCDFEIVEANNYYTVSTVLSKEDAENATGTEATVKGTLDEDTTVAYTNKKTGTIPTGVILSVAPWCIAGIVIIAGVAFFAIRSRKRYEAE